MYFRRALKLNSNYLSAWTLMGHEFVEMKNPSAAIDAYRSAPCQVLPSSCTSPFRRYVVRKMDGGWEGTAEHRRKGCRLLTRQAAPSGGQWT